MTPSPATASRAPQPPGRSVVQALQLAVAGVAALLASGCCVAPLVLALVGVSGTWIVQLRRLAPYSPWLVGLSLGALALAAWQLFRPASNDPSCGVDGAACGDARRAGRRWFWAMALLALVPVLVPLAAPWFY